MPVMPGAENGISRAAAEADLDFLERSLESAHPNPYAARSREQFHQDRERVRAALPDSIDWADWCFRLSALVALLEDGHMVVDCSVATPDYLAVFGTDFFPLRLTIDNEQHLIVTQAVDQDAAISRGDRLLRVSGLNADDLLTAMIHEISGDTLSFRRSKAASRFPVDILRHAKGPPFSVTVIRGDGAERDVLLPIVSDAPGSGASAANRAAPVFTYRVIGKDIGYLDLHSLGTDPNSFKKDTTSLFGQIDRESIGTLIVDLRRNGGGNAFNIDTFLSHLTGKPFRSFSRIEIKRSRELRASGAKPRDTISHYLRGPFHWFPLRFLSGTGRVIFGGTLGSSYVEDIPVEVHKAKPSFRGNVCVLTGPDTYSGAAVLADAVKTYGLGRIIGSPTGGRPNTSGGAIELQFPKSPARLLMPTLYVTRASSDARDRAPVRPDISVETTAADIRAGRDPVLERALTCGQ